MFRSLTISAADPDGAGLVLHAGPLTVFASCSERDRDVLLEKSFPCQVPIVVNLSVTGHSLIPSCYAFASIQRRDLFQALTEIKGIGTTSALSVLDCGEPSDTLRAAAGEDSAYFAPVPGLGKAKIGLVISKLAQRYAGLLPDPIDAPVSALVEAREALVAAGKNDEEAEIALIRALSEAASTPKTAEAWLQLLDSAA